MSDMPWGPQPEEGLPEAENDRRVLAFLEWNLRETHASLALAREANARGGGGLEPGIQSMVDVIASCEARIAKLKAELSAAEP